MVGMTNRSQRSRCNSLVFVALFAWMALATARAAAVDSEEGFFMTYPDSSTTGPEIMQIESLPTVGVSASEGSFTKTVSSSSSSSSSLRGGSIDSRPKENTNEGLELPPIPPFHPVHTGQVHYSSFMDADGTVTYRRDVQAPCDYGMLAFNIGPSLDDLPYHYDVYADAYLWSDNSGLCVLYPTYIGYQLSAHGPFWRPGYDPTTVRFKNLLADPRHMHRISSRILRPAAGATEHANSINKLVAGDYMIMGHHNFYGINFYKELQDYVHRWGPEGPTESDTNEFGWMIFDATA